MEEKRTVIIGSRESMLAVVQAKMVQKFIQENCPQIDVRLLTMKTTGDHILDRALDQIGGKGLFVKELDIALRSRKSDLSVHSLKDVPMEISEELPLIGFSAREDERDVLVLPEGQMQIDFLKPIGTSSLRRELQLRRLYPQASFACIRGNIQTRIRKLDEGQYSAVVMAAAGLKRAGLSHRISRYFSPEEVIPAAGQGILALQGRAGEDYTFLNGFLSQEGALCAWSERAFVTELNGGCTSPVAAHARLQGDVLSLRGLYWKEGMTDYCTGTAQARVTCREDCVKLGQELAQTMSREEA